LKKKVKQAIQLTQSKNTKTAENPDFFNSKYPVWRFSDLDFDFKWGWNYLGSLVKFVLDKDLEEKIISYGDEKLLDSILNMENKHYTYDKLIAHLNRNTNKTATIDILFEISKKLDRDYLKTKIIDKLSEFENTTWEDIKRQTFGKNNKSKHHFQEIGDLHEDAKSRLIELSKDDSQIFSFRLEGSVRIWGILDRGVYSILWFDPYHEIYETDGRDNNTRIIK
jgi:hypothetical protein